MVKKIVTFDCEVPNSFCNVGYEGSHESKEEAEECFKNYQKAKERIEVLKMATNEIKAFFSHLMKTYNLKTEGKVVSIALEERYDPELEIRTTLKVKTK